eukprot:3979412-Amphidinium_carterae.1
MLLRTSRPQDLEATMQAQTGPVPLSNQAWVKWLEENAEKFNTFVRDAPRHRRSINMRLKPKSPYADLETAAACVHEKSAFYTDLRKKLISSAPGFFALRFCSQGKIEMLAFFHSALRGHCLLIPLGATGGDTRHIPLVANMCRVFVELEAMLAPAMTCFAFPTQFCNFDHQRHSAKTWDQSTPLKTWQR